MNKLFTRIMTTGIVAAGAVLAAPVSDITITLPYAVTAGSTVLPGGTYTFSPMETKDGSEYFVVRGGNIEPMILPTQKSEDKTEATKSEVTLTKDGDTWHLGKLSIKGEKTAYELGEN